jgi:alanine dehydrogenase
MSNQIFGSVQETAPQTLAKALAIKLSGGGMSIGIPKESTFQENRVPLTPAAVKFFTSNGHRILIESAAGHNANFSDHQYSEAGAEISNDTFAVFQCDTILKIDPPTSKEIDLSFTSSKISFAKAS